MIKPMLAHKVGIKEVDYTESVFLQPKLDGVRCVITKDGCYTRTGNKWMNVNHIELALKPFFKDNPDIILDGELYNHCLRDNFEKIISLVKKQKPTHGDRLDALELVEFHVYDYISDMPYNIRYSYLKDWFSDGKTRNVIVTSNKDVSSLEMAIRDHKENLKKGYEGSVLRLDKPYECKRSYNLQKFKDFSDKEATIVGYVEGKGKRLGTLGKFIMRDDDGIEFGCPPGKGFNHKQLSNILNSINSYLGKRATFTYFGRTKAMSYRHPMFKILRDYE